MNETTTNLSGLVSSGLISSGTVYSGTPSSITTTTSGDGITLLANASIHYAPIQTNKITPNQNNMVRQVRVAVFTVKRNKENKIVSAELTKELWVEIKNGSSVELAVAKELDKDFDPTNTIIKEMYSITF